MSHWIKLAARGYSWQRIGQQMLPTTSMQRIYKVSIGSNCRQVTTVATRFRYSQEGALLRHSRQIRQTQLLSAVTQSSVAFTSKGAQNNSEQTSVDFLETEKTTCLEREKDFEQAASSYERLSQIYAQQENLLLAWTYLEKASELKK